MSRNPPPPMPPPEPEGSITVGGIPLTVEPAKDDGALEITLHGSGKHHYALYVILNERLHGRAMATLYSTGRDTGNKPSVIYVRPDACDKPLTQQDLKDTCIQLSTEIPGDRALLLAYRTLLDAKRDRHIAERGRKDGGRWPGA